MGCISIQRNIKKGESAKIFLNKHPELKLFLGLNPLSIFLYKRIKKYGLTYKVFQKMYKSKIKLLNRLGFYLLKEYHYLTGILSHN